MCNFIMMGILLVTAYTGIAKKPAGHRIGEGYTQSYSKYFCRLRVRTASGGVPAGLPHHALLMDAPSGSISQYALPEAAGDRIGIIE